MNTITLSDILEFIREENCRVMNPSDREISGVASIYEAGKGDLVFCREMKDSITLIQNTEADTVICDPKIDVTNIKDKTLILVEKPDLWFIRISKQFFPPEPQTTIHQTATINHCVRMGKNVGIGPGSRIGFDGFGYVKNEEGAWEYFPHYGGVVLEDDVEIGANTCIDRGALSDTIIGKGTKIDNLVHIAHNVVIGRNCYIVALTCVGGSAVIGDNVYVGIGSSIKNKVKIGDGAFIGMGSVVVKDVEPHTLVYGVPAKPVRRLDE